MDLSVIIPVYNAAALIGRCLDSIFSQQGKHKVEVICIDDGSTDNSVEIIKNRKEENIVLLQQENSGPSKARNKGIEIAKGEYLAFIDADDYWLPGFIEETLSFLRKNRECIAVSVAQKHITISGVHESPANWQTVVPSYGDVLDDFFSFWNDHNHICTGSITIKTEIAKKTGGMRPELRICEDLEFWAYLATFGKIGYIPKLLFVSDGAKVTEQIGWVKKNLPRWQSAVSVDTWQERIINRLSSNDKKSFIKARGRIGKNLSYSILLSKRYELAKEQIQKYGNDFPNDKLSKLLRLATSNQLFWYIISRLLIWREYHR